MKKRVIIVFSILLLLAALLAACNKQETSTIKFISNGGSEVADIILADGVLSEMPATPQKEGFTFVNWYYDKHCLYVCDLSNPGAIEPHAEITLYARWSAVRYPVIFDLDGGHFEHASTVDNEYTVTSVLWLPLACNLHLEGHTFAGWSDGQTIVSLIPAGSTGEKSFKAVWEINTYDFTFASEDVALGAVSGQAASIVYGEAVSVSAAANYGYKFVGWYDADIKVSGDIDYTFAMPAKNLDLVAKWAVKMSRISLRAVGDLRFDPIDAQIGTPVLPPVVSSEDTPEGMELHWYLDNQFGEEFEFSVMPDTDTVLYGRWEES